MNISRTILFLFSVGPGTALSNHFPAQTGRPGGQVYCGQCTTIVDAAWSASLTRPSERTWSVGVPLNLTMSKRSINR